MTAYRPTIYIHDPETACRYALGVEGENPLFVFGINPSTATDAKPDRTISKVIKHTQILDFDGFIMFNLYPQIATFPDDLDFKPNRLEIEKNVDIFGELLRRYKPSAILAAWGQNISDRPYMHECLEMIYTMSLSHSAKWVHLGSLTKKGHPRHPSRTAYSCRLNDLDIKTYLLSI